MKLNYLQKNHLLTICVRSKASKIDTF